MSETTRNADDGFDWAIVEVYGHRRHVGKMREEERFGTKMLRIDVPTLAPNDLVDGQPQTFTVTSWLTHWYGGQAVFSLTLTDEESGLKANRPYVSARRYLAPPDSVDVDDGDDGIPFDGSVAEDRAHG